MNYERRDFTRLHEETAMLWAVLAVVCALTACEQAELTQTIVIIDADSEVLDRTHSLSLHATGVASDEPSFTKRLVEPDWPIRLVFRPEDPQAPERFRVTADARDAEDERIAIGTLATDFVRNQARFVRFVLGAGCLNADNVARRDAAKLARSSADATRVPACDAEPADGPEAPTDGGPPEAGESDGSPTGMDENSTDPPDEMPPAAASGGSGTTPSGIQPEDGCAPGMDGGTCPGPDPCAEPGACGANEACTPAADGGVSCSCMHGFERRGADCVPLRTCAEENGGCEQLCTMQDGRRRCACTPPARLSADGHACREYGAPERLDHEDMDPGTLEVTMGADGTAFVSWIQNGTIWINRHRPAEGWSGALPNNEPVQNYDLLALAPDATGGALVAWTVQGTATSSAQAAHYDGASRRWEVPWRVDDASAGLIDQLGVFGGYGEDFIVGMLTDDLRAQTRRITTRRVAVPIVFHNAVTRDLATDAQGGLAFALDSAGRGVVAWTHSRTATSLPVQTRYVPESGTIAASAIDAGGSLLGGPRVGLTRAGEPIAVWYESDAMPAQHLIAAVGELAGTWGTVTSSPPVGKITLYAPEVAFAGDGRAMVVWQDRSALEGAVRASLFTPGQGWTDPQRLDPANAPIADWLDVAGDGEGNFFATWTQWRAVTQETSAQDVWASRYVAGVGWEPAVLVEHDDVGNMTDVRVAIASAEQAVVVFRRSASDSSSLWASRFD